MLYSFGVLTGLDVDTILFQSKNSAGSTQRISFNASPDLSAIKKGMLAIVSGSTNSSNDGEYFITDIDNTAKVD